MRASLPMTTHTRRCMQRVPHIYALTLLKAQDPSPPEPPPGPGPQSGPSQRPPVSAAVHMAGMGAGVRMYKGGLLVPYLLAVQHVRAATCSGGACIPAPCLQAALALASCCTGRV